MDSLRVYRRCLRTDVNVIGTVAAQYGAHRQFLNVIAQWRYGQRSSSTLEEFLVRLLVYAYALYMD